MEETPHSAPAERGSGVMALLALTTLALAGCGAKSPFQSKACTLRGCVDQFSATVTFASAAFPMGTHQLDVTTDVGALSCSFTFPAPKLPNGVNATRSAHPD
jgi:hypothetical protein